MQIGAGKSLTKSRYLKSLGEALPCTFQINTHHNHQLQPQTGRSLFNKSTTNRSHHFLCHHGTKERTEICISLAFMLHLTLLIPRVIDVCNIELYSSSACGLLGKAQVHLDKMVGLLYRFLCLTELAFGKRGVISNLLQIANK